MKPQISEVEQDMLAHGVPFQVLRKSYVGEGEEDLHKKVIAESKYEDHRVWQLFSWGGKAGNAEDRAKLLHALYHKECYGLDMPVKEVMMVDLLKMGNKRRYEIDLDIDFISIPDFYLKIYGDKYSGIEAPSVLRWMAYITGRYGVGFILYVDTNDKKPIEDFFNTKLFKYYSGYLIINDVVDA